MLYALFHWYVKVIYNFVEDEIEKVCINYLTFDEYSDLFDIFPNCIYIFNEIMLYDSGVIDD